MPRILDSSVSKFKRAVEIAKKYAVKDRHKKLQRDHALRVDDLVVRFHQVKKVRLPLPSLYAMHWITSYYGGEPEDVDYNDDLKLASVVWILENQHDPGRITSLSPEDVEIEIIKRAAEIPMFQKLDYIACIQDMFAAIKKNFLQQQVSLLELSDEVWNQIWDSSSSGDQTH